MISDKISDNNRLNNKTKLVMTRFSNLKTEDNMIL